MRLDPMRLLVLRAVAESGAVVAAGRRLHLAPSGVSQHIASLERETAWYSWTALGGEVNDPHS